MPPTDSTSPISPLLPSNSGYDASVAETGNRILADNRHSSGLADVPGVASDLVAAQNADPEHVVALQNYVSDQLLPVDALLLPQALDAAKAAANATPVDPMHGVSLSTSTADNERTILDSAYREMAQQVGLSPRATAEFVKRAGALDDGKIHAVSPSTVSDGPIIGAGALAQAKANGRIVVAPTAAQAGLLKLLQNQDQMRGADETSFPNGAAAGIPFLPRAGQQSGTPGNTAVTPDIAAEILKNVSGGKPPFKPELGQVGGVSWFVTGGNPYPGTGADKSVTLPVEVNNTSGKPSLQFGERELLEIYNAKYEQARGTVEQQIRQNVGKTNGEPLSNKNQRTIERQTRQLAERQMWTEVGQRVSASESGIGKVVLRDSVFSRAGNGEFTLTSHAENVRIRGGAKALLDIIKDEGVPAEDGVLKSAQDLATREGWAGKVQGAFRVGGRVLIVVGVAADAYRVYTAQDKAKTITEVAGGWAGAAAVGSAAAEVAAPLDAGGPWGWLAHGAITLGAGAVGYFAGSTAARTIYELTVEGKPIEIGN